MWVINERHMRQPTYGSIVNCARNIRLRPFVILHHRRGSMVVVRLSVRRIRVRRMRVVRIMSMVALRYLLLDSNGVLE